MSGSSAQGAREAQEYLRQVEAALRANDFPGAAAIASQAVEKGHLHPSLLTLAVYRRIAERNFPLALDYAQKAREAAPHSADALQAHARALAELGRHEEALTVFNAALRKAPGAQNILFYRALSLEALSDIDRALREFERVVEIAPHAGAFGKLADHAAQRAQVAKARDYAQRALRLEPGQPTALLALAQVELIDKNYEKAIAHASPLTSAQNPRIINRSIAIGLIADALHGQGKFPEAFAQYAASNALLNGYFGPGYAALGGETALARARRLNGYFEHASALDWRDVHAGYVKSPVKTHVFLVGFPRSGTTLLENILSSHGEIESMEERDCMLDAIKDFLAPPDGLDRLATLDAEALDQYRENYWQDVRAQGVKLKKPVFIDKMPLYSINLCLISKLFPDAKILLALRDPRDVVLSSFRRRFAMTDQMLELLTLDGAANYYDAVMSLLTTYREKLSLPFQETRYEDLVASPETQIRMICDFLGLEYDAQMQNFAELARSRVITTPSAPQVVEGIYRRGQDQWRPYASQLAPVLPTLAPWIKKFGYAEE